MGNTYVKCKYCGGVAERGSTCSSCRKKLKLIRQIQAMVRKYKEDVERSKHNESEN